MKREELLTKLAMEVGEWPYGATDYPGLPGSWCWQFNGGGEASARHTEGNVITEADWLAERERLINKPSWDDAPEKAQWLAQDPDGEWGFWISKPDADDDEDSTCEGWAGKETCAEYNQRELHKGAIPAGHDWRQTLEQRPAEWPSEERIDRIGQSGPTGDHYDAVKKPSHYQSENGIECIEAIRAALGREGFIAHCRGTAIKYAWRSGKKAEHAEDLRKACAYLEWAAQAIEEATHE